MGTRFLCLFLFIPFVLSLASFTSLGKAWAEGKRGACNVPPPRGQRTGELRKMYAAMIYKSRMRVTMNKKKKKIYLYLYLYTHSYTHKQSVFGNMVLIIIPVPPLFGPHTITPALTRLVGYSWQPWLLYDYITTNRMRPSY